MTLKWDKGSWRGFSAKQLPEYESKEKLLQVEAKLSKYPPLVFAGEIRTLKSNISDACEGKSFILQGGDCAESFSEFNAQHIKNTYKTILQMAVVLTYKSKMPVVKIARMAGQYAKPRSTAVENKDGKVLPSYKGDIINGYAFDEESREPDPSRMLTAYFHSATTQNLLRAFSYGGLADLHQVHSWNRAFLNDNALHDEYRKISDSITDSLDFMESIGVTKENSSAFSETSIYTSHEGLLLNYEEALTRKDTLTGLNYCCSAHMLWIGERTRQLDYAHVEFFRGINNPIGVKIGPSANPRDISKLVEILNPKNEKGRITLITRMGKEIEKSLPPVIEFISQKGFHVTWVCDPMHGNTVTSSSGLKTRYFDDIFREICSFFAIHKKLGTFPGGIHLEMTGDNVTECIGGSGNQAITDKALPSKYKSFCDPRLNGSQVLELSFKLADMMGNVI